MHVLDLLPEGSIGRHVDHVEYSGQYILGLSLASHAVMRLLHQSSDSACELLLPRRSLYLLHGPARYEWAHEVPAQPTFEGRELPPKGRRVSILLRDRNPSDATSMQ